MIFLLSYTNDFESKWKPEEKEIKNLEELIAYRDELNEEIIIGRDIDGKLTLEVYNDYRE